MWMKYGNRKKAHEHRPSATLRDLFWENRVAPKFDRKKSNEKIRKTHTHMLLLLLFLSWFRNVWQMAKFSCYPGIMVDSCFDCFGCLCRHCCVNIVELNATPHARTLPLLYLLLWHQEWREQKKQKSAEHEQTNGKRENNGHIEKG